MQTARRHKHFYSVAALEGCTIERFAGDARLHVAEGDPCLIAPVVRDQVGDSVAIHIPGMAAATMGRMRSNTASLAIPTIVPLISEAGRVTSLTVIGNTSST